MGGVLNELVIGEPTFRFTLGSKFESCIGDPQFGVMLGDTDNEVVSELVRVGEGEVDLLTGEDMEARFVEGEFAGDGVDEDIAGVANGSLRNLAPGRTFRKDPDIAKADRVAVVLQVEWSESALLDEGCCGSGLGEHDVFLDDDSV